MSVYVKEISGLCFKSNRVKVHPCGRRGSTINQKAFDPESFLNTERNRIGKTALNGYQDSYIVSYDDTGLKVVINGYYFELAPESNGEAALSGTPTIPTAKQLFGPAIETLFTGGQDKQEGQEDVAGALYLDIILDKVQIQLQAETGTDATPVSSTTDMLGSWYTPPDHDRYLDVDTLPSDNPDGQYYFTGLRCRFAATGESGTEDQFALASSAGTASSESGRIIHWLRICNIHSTDILSPITLYQPACLPRSIVHGGTENSVLIKGDAAIKGELEIADTLTMSTAMVPTGVDNQERRSVTTTFLSSVVNTQKVIMQNTLETPAFSTNATNLDVTGNTNISNSLKVNLQATEEDTDDYNFMVTGTAAEASTTKKNDAFFVAGTTSTESDGSVKLHFWVNKNPPAAAT